MPLSPLTQPSLTPLLNPLMHNPVLFITGGAQGIGRACVALFLEKGYKVGLFDQQVATAFVGEERVQHFLGDTTDSAAVAAALEATVARFGRLDVLCPCAGIHELGTLWEVSEKTFDRILEVNVKGVFLTLKHGVPWMLRQGSGSIVLIGSDQSFAPRAQSAAYATSKGAIAMMTQSLALDLTGKGIRVNAVCPGTIDTPLTQRILKALNRGPFEGPMGSPEQVAHWVYFLACAESQATSGSLVRL